MNPYLIVKNFNLRNYIEKIQEKEISWFIKHDVFAMKKEKFRRIIEGLEHDRNNNNKYSDLIAKIIKEVLGLICDCSKSVKFATEFTRQLKQILDLTDDIPTRNIFATEEEIANTLR